MSLVLAGLVEHVRLRVDGVPGRRLAGQGALGEQPRLGDGAALVQDQVEGRGEAGPVGTKDAVSATRPGNVRGRRGAPAADPVPENPRRPDPARRPPYRGDLVAVTQET